MTTIVVPLDRITRILDHQLERECEDCGCPLRRTPNPIVWNCDYRRCRCHRVAA